MAYIGQIPPPAAVTSSDITDLTIATADIPADAITAAKIADNVVATEHLNYDEATLTFD